MGVTVGGVPASAGATVPGGLVAVVGDGAPAQVARRHRRDRPVRPGAIARADGVPRRRRRSPACCRTPAPPIELSGSLLGASAVAAGAAMMVAGRRRGGDRSMRATAVGRGPGSRRDVRPPWLGSNISLLHCRESRASISQPGSLGRDLGVGAADLAHARLVVADDVGRQLAGERQQLVVGHDVVDEPPLQRLVGRHEVAGEAHLAGPAHADRLRQQHGEAPAGHDARPGSACRRTWPRSEATRKSQFSASSNPPVMATPLMAPISGLRESPGTGRGRRSEFGRSVGTGAAEVAAAASPAPSGRGRRRRPDRRR